MKIVDRETFLKMPPETIYQKYEPTSFDRGICIKGDTSGEDWWCVDLGGVWPADCDDSEALMDRYLAMDEQGAPSGSLDFDGMGRDGLFDREQRFAVWDKEDVQALVSRLQKTIGADAAPR